MQSITSSALNSFIHSTSKKRKNAKRPIPNSNEESCFSSDDRAETKKRNSKKMPNTATAMKLFKISKPIMTDSSDSDDNNKAEKSLLNDRFFFNQSTEEEEQQCQTAVILMLIQKRNILYQSHHLLLLYYFNLKLLCKKQSNHVKVLKLHHLLLSKN